MKKYSPGVYQIINDNGGTRAYLLDNQRYTLEGTTMGVLVVYDNLIDINGDIKVHKIANNYDQVIGAWHQG